MWDYLFGYTIACMLALPEKSFTYPSNNSIIVDEKTIIKYEEYIIEHDISQEQARNAALAIDLNSIETPPGCQECTRAEINYCLGSDFINDHCCCDKRYHEVLSFIPHTCYLGAQLCKPVAGDCPTYNRLRLCCCNKHVIKKWKSGATSIIHSLVIKLFCLLSLLKFILL